MQLAVEVGAVEVVAAAEAAAGDVDSREVTDAVAAVLLQDAPPSIVVESYQETAAHIAVEKSALAAADTDGRWWPSGLLAACHSHQLLDRRLAFLDALPRSMVFGARLANMCAASCTGSRARPESLEMARLVNIFVTLFDGVCDEVPELLPIILPCVRERFAHFPVPGDPAPSQSQDLLRLIDAVLIRCFASLHSPFTRASAERQLRVGRAVHEAMSAQLHTLLQTPLLRDGKGCSEALLQTRTHVSVATLEATLQLAALLESVDDQSSCSLTQIARAAGELCGWIDDLADLQIDEASGRANAVALFAHIHSLGASSSELPAIVSETERRWLLLRQSAQALPYPELLTNPLQRAMIAWLAT